MAITDSRVSGYLTAVHDPAVAVPLEAVAAVYREKASAERQGWVPAVAPAVAWVFELGS